MRFKHEELRDEFHSRPTFLQQMAHDFETLSLENGVVPVVTRVLERIEGSSGVHEAGRAIDFRDEVRDASSQDTCFSYSRHTREDILRRLNAKYRRKDGRATLIWHSFQKGAYHWHLQLAFDLKTYETHEERTFPMSEELVVAPELGIKELKEAIAGVNELALALIPLVKDGIQLSDAVSLGARIASDEALKTALANAVMGINGIPAEVKDISLVEGLDLVQMQVAFVPKIVAALKG